MRHAMRVFPLLLAVGALPALGAPVLYTIHFNLTLGSTLPTSGSFYYDSSTSTFTSFIVVWNGDTFDLTSSANTPGVFVASPDPCYSGATTNPQQVFLMLTACSADANPTYYHSAPYWITFTPGSAQSFEISTGAYAPPVVQVGLMINSPANTGSAQGGFSSSSSAPPPSTPAPGSGVLMLIALCFLVIATGLRSATRTHRSLP
jgi:hypothetical protein